MSTGCDSLVAINLATSMIDDDDDDEDDRILCVVRDLHSATYTKKITPQVRI